MLIDQAIFKAYDFRGIYPTQLNEEIMERIARAFVEFLGAKEVLVGWDMRLSSEALKNAFTRGATKQGAKVVQLGMVTTDALYFASGKYNLPGVMITASHNPKDYNGVKFCRAMAAPVSQDTGLLEIKEKVLRNEFVDASVIGAVEDRVGALEDLRDERNRQGTGAGVVASGARRDARRHRVHDGQAGDPPVEPDGARRDGVRQLGVQPAALSRRGGPGADRPHRGQAVHRVAPALGGAGAVCRAGGRPAFGKTYHPRSVNPGP